MLQEAYLMNVEGRAPDTRNPAMAGGAVQPWADAPAYVLIVDLLAMFAAVALPWSATVTTVLMVGWSIAVIPTIDWDELIRSLALPACALPLALFVLADIGVLWSDGPWEFGLQAVNPVSKLLLLPLLLQHFRRSDRVLWVLIGFVLSSAIMMMLSWVALADPSTLTAALPVEQALGRHQPFTLCALALVGPALVGYLRGQTGAAFALAGLGALFFSHELLVTPAQTICIAITTLMLVLAIRHLSRRLAMLLLGAAAVTGSVAWAASPLLSRPIVQNVVQHHLTLSGGGAMEGRPDWRRTMASLAEAPLLGHGTGAMRPPFAADARPPQQMRGTGHDVQTQSLYVAWQWGLVGLVLLGAMWIGHIRLVRGRDGIAWVGLTIVVQTCVGSLVSGNVFGVNEGWVYVIGLGAAGGVALRRRVGDPDKASAIVADADLPVGSVF
ncbi:conserved membrane hypothetical protein [Bradyrhizobium sp. ORS 375]|nr:conserved membrane hypothetical protein [Bradyrhizobium sp. ORS 375]